MKKKRVLIDVNSIITYIKTGCISGIGRTTYELLKQWNLTLDQIPFEIVLYSLNTKGVTPKGLFKFRSVHFFWPNRDAYKKLLYYMHLRKLATGYDIIHIPNNVDVIEDIEKTVLTIHDVMNYRFANEWNSAKWQCSDEEKKRLEYAASKCKAIITCSECSKNDIVKYLHVPETKVYSIPWGINREMFKPTYNEDFIAKIGVKGLYYFTSSANHPRKNLSLLLKSFSRYLELGGKGQLVILNPEEQYLEGYESLMDAKSVIVLRNVSDMELCVLYSHAHCTLMLSSYEGFGLPILESLACHTQVISANNSSLPEVGADIVDYVEDMSEDKIAQKLLSYDSKDKSILLDEEKLESHLRHFSWRECANRYIELYTTLLS